MVYWTLTYNFHKGQKGWQTQWKIMEHYCWFTTKLLLLLRWKKEMTYQSYYIYVIYASQLRKAEGNHGVHVGITVNVRKAVPPKINSRKCRKSCITWKHVIFKKLCSLKVFILNVGKAALPKMNYQMLKSKHCHMKWIVVNLERGVEKRMYLKC